MINRLRNKFIDSTIIRVTAGNGGNGNVSFRREKFVPKGGPDGGNGGNGGSVILLCDPNSFGLSEVNYIKEFKAESGQNGKSKNRTGRNGKDLFLKVPKGTLIWRVNNKRSIFVGELLKENDSIVIAKGGKGGSGNKKFVAPSNQEPLLAEAGEKENDFSIKMELRLIADVGLIGLPNVGKSSVISSITNAKPKIADYPFTTMEPIVGILNEKWASITIAEIPGLVEQASTGKGLGHQFLKHAKRVNLMVHILDGSKKDIREDFDKINRELQLYDQDLLSIKKIVAINKMDLIENFNNVNEVKINLEREGWQVLKISALTGEGMEILKEVVIREAENYSSPKQVFYQDKRLKKPKETALKITKNKVFILDREIVQIAHGTDLTNPYAQIQFYKEMKKRGISKLLENAGVKRGDKVWIGDIEMVMG